ncbi:MAG: bifunctional folylpolyglutamate synthase/dihydrofolate synthase [Clostridia bacterium]|nr:bifunctional folylpolyglutamate synthase/dihydrofolate synthase [Clostridia bacterium]
MNYDQAVQFIHDTKKFGSKLGLKNITTLLELLGNPQNSLKFVHVAGTNGKGSVCSYIATVMMEAGYKTGLFISPYIEKFTERIQIDFNNMNEDHLVDIITRIRHCINIMLSNHMNHPTEFEINTALAMTYFYEQRCEVVVLETGLGGRFDSTNVIKDNLVSVITALGLDHIGVLGDSIEKIAFEKAGIIKESCPLVLYGDNDIVANELIKHIAKLKNSSVTISDYKKAENVRQNAYGVVFDYKELKNITINLPGGHQIKNAVTALDALFVLREKGYDLSDQSILSGMAKAKWPGRLEFLSKNPEVLCDGAHNSHAAYALRAYLDQFHSHRNIIFVMGVMSNKDYEKMVEIVIKNAKAVICIQPDSERSLPKEVLAEVIKKFCHNVYVSDTINSGLDLAYNLQSGDDLICTFGSLYYIADVKKYVREKK